MASKDLGDQLTDLILKDVIPQGKELGHGAYGRVFIVNYLGLSCAAKEIHALLLNGVNAEDKKAIKDSFMRECYHSSKIRHPNIVQFIGVYYTEQSDLPIMVMELMDTGLTSFIEENKFKIAVGTKLSILHDVSLGLSYLHGRHPAIIHRDLSSNNVLLSKDSRVAKISDLGMARMIKADSKQTRSRLTTAPGTLHFMPPEALDEEDPIYGTPIDVFSFAGVALHLFSEDWPTPSAQKKRDPSTKKLVALSEAQRRQQYLDKMINVTVLRETVVRCLEDDPDERPKIYEVSQILEGLKTANLEANTQLEDIKVPIDQSNPVKLTTLEEVIGNQPENVTLSSYSVKTTKLTTSEEVIDNKLENVTLSSNSVKTTKTADLEAKTQFEDIKVPINQSNPVKATILPEPHKEATITSVRHFPNDIDDGVNDEDMFFDDYEDDEPDWDGYDYDPDEGHDYDDDHDFGDFHDDDYYGDDDNYDDY